MVRREGRTLDLRSYATELALLEAVVGEVNVSLSLVSRACAKWWKERGGISVLTLV